MSLREPTVMCMVALRVTLASLAVPETNLSPPRTLAVDGDKTTRNGRIRELSTCSVYLVSSQGLAKAWPLVFISGTKHAKAHYLHTHSLRDT